MVAKNKLIRIFNVVFCGIFYYLLILAVGKMNLQSPISALLAIPYFYFLYNIIKKENVCTFNVKKTWCILQAVSCIVMLIMAYQLRVAVSWDWGQLLRTAYNYIMIGEIDNPEYFMRYPFNQIWLVCLIALFKIVSKCTASLDFAVYKAVSMVVGICLIQITICFIYKTAKLIWDERKAFLVGIFSLLYVPFYLYSMFLYTDIPGVCLAALLMYCEVKICRTEGKKRYFYISMFGVLGALIFRIKMVTFIAFIAVIIVFIFKNICSFSKILIILLCFLGSYLLIGMVDNILGIDENETAQYKFPFTHCIMMSLNTTGGYNGDDVNYTASFDTYDEKKEANILKIKERIADYGFTGTVKHILYTKQCRTWANSCLDGDNYVSRWPVLEASLCQKIFSQNGKWHWTCLVYTWLVHITILVGMLLSATLSIKKEMLEQQSLGGRIAVFGIFLFLSIWECNSRYLLTLMPIMILTAADGLFTAYNRISLLKGK